MKQAVVFKVGMGEVITDYSFRKTDANRQLGYDRQRGTGRPKEGFYWRWFQGGGCVEHEGKSQQRRKDGIWARLASRCAHSASDIWELTRRSAEIAVSVFISVCVS